MLYLINLLQVGTRMMKMKKKIHGYNIKILNHIKQKMMKQRELKLEKRMKVNP